MLWKLEKQRQQEVIQKELKENKTKTKPAAGVGATSSSSTSSSFSISRLLPFSWISSKIMPKTKQRTATRTDPSPNIKTTSYSPPPPSAPPRRSPGFPSCHESFRRAAAAGLDREPPRFPPPVIPGVGADVSHSHSLGDDDGRQPPKLDKFWRADLRRHHHSVGDLQLPELRQLIQFSSRLGTAEPDRESDASFDYEAPSPPRRQLRGPWRNNSAARPSEGNRVDAGPRKSFSGKTRRHRARPKVKISSPRPSVTVRRRKSPKVGEEKMRELERFAVVKRSRDPQSDFRESMVEMIWERGIGSSEELESLLACYLSLNAEEHHDAIVKVFRQVWFELKPESQYCYCY